MLRPLTEADVEFEIECVPEDRPIYGNASTIDGETDAQVEQDIREELGTATNGPGAWSGVTARWAEYEGYDYRGGCSYRSEEQFKHPDGYYPVMKARALADLNDVIATHARNLEPLLVCV